MTKEEFIGKYMNRVMKDHGLSYGLAYFNLHAEQEEKAEKAWKRFYKRDGTYRGFA